MKKIIISTYDDIRNPYYAGGGAMACHRVAQDLIKNYDVTVITGKYPGSINEKVDHVNYKRIGFTFAGPKLGQFIYQLLLPFYAMRLKYDLWIESFTPPTSTAFLPLFTKKPVIGLVHMLSAIDMERKYKLPFHIVENFGLKRYKNFIVTTELFKDKISKVSKFSNIKVIPVGVDLPETKISYESEEKYILYIGRIEMDQKGIDLLLKSYKEIEAKTHYKLLIAGSGTATEEEKLRSEIRKMGLEKRVVVYGRVSGEEKNKLFANAIVMVSPSRFETFGIVMLEALSYGTPVICYGIEQYAWAKNAILRVPPFDYKKFGEELLRLTEDENLRKQLSSSGKKIVEDYSWDKIYEKYSNTIGEILNPQRIEKKSEVMNYIIKNKIHCYFVSPHLDDAAFSAGYLLNYLSKHTKVTVINVLTSPGNSPYTLSAKTFLKQTKYNSVKELVADRVNEDREIFSKYNIEVINLPFEDSLWRKKEKVGKFSKFMSRFLPELIHVYPTYKWHIASGKISDDDFYFYEKLRNKLQEIITQKDFVFCPAGYGGHVDHLVAREACKNAFENVIYWSDFPYCLNNSKNSFIKNEYLSKFSFESSRKVKLDLIRGYKSQVPAIFGESEIPLIKEKYYTHQYLFKSL